MTRSTPTSNSRWKKSRGSARPPIRSSTTCATACNDHAMPCNAPAKFVGAFFLTSAVIARYKWQKGPAMKMFALLLAFVIATPALAAVYKTVRPDGSVTYSDQPPRDEAQPHTLPPLQTIPAENLAPAAPAPNRSNTAPVAEIYQRLAIVQPEQAATLRDNPGNITVQVALDPPLVTKEGDYIDIALDGTPAAQGSGSGYTLTNIDRGAHTVEASVSSAAGQTLIRSAPVTFHLQRTSVNRPLAH